MPIQVSAGTQAHCWIDDGESTAQAASTTASTSGSRHSHTFDTEALAPAQVTAPTALHTLPSLWSRLLQALEQWTSNGLQGALGLSAEQMAITDAWLLQERMTTWASPITTPGPSSTADTGAQSTNSESSEESFASSDSSTESEAENAEISSIVQMEGTADADVLLLTGDQVQIRSGSGADLLLLAARQVTLLFHAEDGINGADTILGFWQGQDRIVLRQEESSQPFTPADIHWIDDRVSSHFSGGGSLLAKHASAPTIVITHWNGSAHDQQQHLWVDWDGQGDAPIQHVATLVGSQPLQESDVFFMMD